LALKYIAAVFAAIAALDRLFGNRFRLGQAFEKGFKLIGPLALSMVGMTVMAPVIAQLIRPLIPAEGFIDPSIIPAMLFANDMGGAPLSVELASHAETGMFNAMVVSAMMGCTVSYSIPVGLELAPAGSHKPMSLGIMCGVVTIPLGCIVGGLVCGMGIVPLLKDMIPVAALAAVIVLGLIRYPNAAMKAFKALGFVIKALITAGLILGILDFLLEFRPVECIGSFKEGFDIVINASVIMMGAFPLLEIVSRLLKKPFSAFGRLLGINEAAALGFISSMATSVTTMGNFDQMDGKGVLINSAYMVSGAFIFAGHLAFTLAFNEAYVLPVIVGKFAAGISAAALAMLLYPGFRKLLAKEA